jgi:hypothetical protein
MEEKVSSETRAGVESIRRALPGREESRNLGRKSKAWIPEAAVIRVTGGVRLAWGKKGKS